MTGKFPWEEEEQISHPNITPLAGGNPTKEEEEAAFEELFTESRNTLNKWSNESRGNL